MVVGSFFFDLVDVTFFLVGAVVLFLRLIGVLDFFLFAISISVLRLPCSCLTFFFGPVFASICSSTSFLPTVFCRRLDILFFLLCDVFGF